MLYHCHVQTAQHYLMGLNGLFVVEENRPNNWVQTFNIGAGQVRHPSVAVREKYHSEFDLFYQSIDKRLSQIIQKANDVRLISKRMSREYNMTESVENYFMLNGHSFPYTVRDSLVTVAADEKIKLRLANADRTPIAIHFHGHKPTVTSYDGVDQPENMRITRDVIDIAPAQRVDLSLSTLNDGLHSYGPGLWMFHDHVLTGTTTDGMEPGGNMAILAYSELLDEQGMPKGHGELFDITFDKQYYAKTQALWNDGLFAQLLGDPGMFEPDWLRIVGFGLCVGLAAGLIVIAFIQRKRKSIQ